MKFLVTNDHHCGLFELEYQLDATSESVVGKLKYNFCHDGNPHTLNSDNGPQFGGSQQMCANVSVCARF